MSVPTPGTPAVAGSAGKAIRAFASRQTGVPRKKLIPVGAPLSPAVAGGADVAITFKASTPQISPDLSILVARDYSHAVTGGARQAIAAYVVASRFRFIPRDILTHVVALGCNAVAGGAGRTRNTFVGTQCAGAVAREIYKLTPVVTRYHYATVAGSAGGTVEAVAKDLVLVRRTLRSCRWT